MKKLTWFFDLDNTLHDASFAIFDAINETISAYLVEHLAISVFEADRMRIDYWRRYGATLLGVVKHHGIDAHHFLRETHAFAEAPDFAAMIRAEHGLTRLFRCLPGRKILLTNAPTHYASVVLRHIGLQRHFKGASGRRYAIEHMRVHGRYRPKPSRALLRMLLAKEGVRAGQAVLLDDSLENLRSARAVGMRTIQVNGIVPSGGSMPFHHRQQRRASYVDLQVKLVGQLLKRRRFMR